ncbi:ATP-grasp domain-containing protein [Streptomyces buecherae]|uniref:ATP-grasp domain-containing protein n=1 Tax=Streptomyces buecherae TaxID=2763006 RepID=UPI0033F644ED
MADLRPDSAATRSTLNGLKESQEFTMTTSCRTEEPISDRSGPAVLIGVTPAEGPDTLQRLGIPFIWVIDTEDEEPAPVQGAIQVLRAPFYDDPLSVLRLPLPGSVCGVFSFTEFGSWPAALLSEALALPTVPSRAVLRTRNKLLMRRALTSQFNKPAFGIAGHDEPADEDFPLIVKPVEGTASRGVELLADHSTWRARKGDLNGLMWEQYIPGPEYSVEAVSFAGEHRILAITAKQTTGAPHFVEKRHEAPAPLAPDDAMEIHDCVIRCLDALEVTLGATHTEVKLNNGRATVIETHTRGGGDRIPLLTKLVTGLDQYELAVQSVVPWAEVKERAPVHARAAVHYFPWEEVTIDSIESADECRSLDGVAEIRLGVEGGETVPRWRHSHDRPGYVVAGGYDAEDLDQRIEAVTRQLRVTFH